MVEPLDFDTSYNVTPGKHFYQFYKDGDDYVRVMIPYFESGLRQGEACLWLVSEKIGLEKAKAAAEAGIPEYLFYLASGQFEILPAEEWYFSRGRFHPERAMEKAQAHIGSILQRGFHRLRGAGDIGQIERRDWPLVHEYERQIGPVIKTAPVIALCAYPIFDCTISDTKAILEGHDTVLMGRF